MEVSHGNDPSTSTGSMAAINGTSFTLPDRTGRPHNAVDDVTKKPLEQARNVSIDDRTAYFSLLQTGLAHDTGLSA